MKGHITEVGDELMLCYDHWQGNGIKAMNYDTFEFSSVPLYNIVPISNANEHELHRGKKVDFELIDWCTCINTEGCSHDAICGKCENLKKYAKII